MPPDSEPDFRLATPADADLLLDFMRDYYAFDGHHYDREAARAALLGLLHNPAFGSVWLIFDAAPGVPSPVGYVVLCHGYSLEYLGRDAFIDELYLVESYRGRGWGKRTMQFVQEEAHRQGIRAIHLEVVRRNTAALNFYLKLGFQDHDEDHDHHLMTLRLKEKH